MPKARVKMFNVTTLDLNKLPTSGGRVDYSQDYFGKKTNLTVSGQLGGECFLPWDSVGLYLRPDLSLGK